MNAEDRDVQRIAVAVLALALNDARLTGHDPQSRRLRDRALRWIRVADENFRWWCEIARIDADAFRRVVINETGGRIRRQYPPRRAA